jgi:hypothetical protein
MRALTILAILCSAPLSAGCARAPASECGEAYDHMITLAKRPPAPEARDPFVAACVEAWDAERHACLMAATSADDALACRSQRAGKP